MIYRQTLQGYCTAGTKIMYNVGGGVGWGSCIYTCIESTYSSTGQSLFSVFLNDQVSTAFKGLYYGHMT